MRRLGHHPLQMNLYSRRRGVRAKSNQIKNANKVAGLSPPAPALLPELLEDELELLDEELLLDDELLLDEELLLVEELLLDEELLDPPGISDGGVPLYPSCPSRVIERTR